MSEDTEATRPLQRPDAGRDTEPVTAPVEPPPATAPEASAQHRATAEEPAPGAPPPVDRPPAAAGGDRSPLSAPVETLRQPESRAWLLLAGAALSLVNLVLLIAVLAAVTDELSDRIVEVEGQRCLVVEEEDANVLYCQR